MPKKSKELTGVKEIARRAKVSIGTVDRVIHNRTGVSLKTKEKINQIIKEINYQPNILGRILATKKKFRFASFIPKVSVETSFWEAPLKGVERAEAEIKQFGIEIKKFFYDQNDKNSFVSQAQNILKEQLDGILIAPSFIDESISFTNRCRRQNIPYVFIDSDIPDQPSLSYIGPDMYRSGYLAANLGKYLVGENEKILVVNISAEIDNHHHLLRKEEGFRGYFRSHEIPVSIEKIDIRKTNYNAIRKELDQVLSIHKDIRLIVVTNSKVSKVAQYLKEAKKDIKLIGYDFVKENIGYMEDEVIDFLICQKPGEQAYKGIISLYKHVVLKEKVEENHYMPINIIMKTNAAFYSN